MIGTTQPMSMKLLLDSHTHTLASGHAYNTIQEMISSAAEKGLKLLSITEHGPKMPGTCAEFYFDNIRILPRFQKGIQVLFGAEVNILDTYGTVDLSEQQMSHLDVIVASLHPPCIQSGSREQNTNAYIGAMKNPWISIIGHPDDGRYPTDYPRLVKAAKEFHVLLEVNNSSLTPTSYRQNAREHYIEMLALCMEHKVPIVINSDAHAEHLVGSFSEALALLEELNFPESLVANCSLDLFQAFLPRR